ncbi:MAG: hypothetical protein JNL32_00440 [Candidatus Kapabacteria bacterium]|nr:hypothetical protein [Candidatus Kapabacteria bacterium]
MRISYQHTVSFLRSAFCIITCLCAAPLQSQDKTSAQPYLNYPAPYSTFDSQISIGTHITFVPRPITEEEIGQIPALNIHTRLGLPLGFGAQLRGGTNYLTNFAALGGMWGFSAGRLAVGIGDDVSLWYGRAVFDAFDVDAVGWLNSPYISAGFDFGNVMLTARAELLFVTSRTTRSGDIEIASDRNLFSGGALSLWLEQPFFGSTHLILGLKLNRLSSAYQTWLAFSTFRDALLYPEFSAEILL